VLAELSLKPLLVVDVEGAGTLQCQHKQVALTHGACPSERARDERLDMCG
jgi:hypothetical protein